ncbi:hypothetical protein ACFQ61_02400 [Streptomyces sp. NPDC056500]|uniref:hypothetical protein n=1 Tax=Streptomyces sp. NPDC056500 TaxID=3345840 RepID=UPI00369A6015
MKVDLRPQITTRLTEVQARATELATLTTSLHQTLKHLNTLPNHTNRLRPGVGLPLSVDGSAHEQTGGRGTFPYHRASMTMVIGHRGSSLRMSPPAESTTPSAPGNSS